MPNYDCAFYCKYSYTTPPLNTYYIIINYISMIPTTITNYYYYHYYFWVLTVHTSTFIGTTTAGTTADAPGAPDSGSQMIFSWGVGECDIKNKTKFNTLTL